MRLLGTLFVLVLGFLSFMLLVKACLMVGGYGWDMRYASL